MRNFLLTLALFGTLLLSACAGSSHSSPEVITPNPKPPTNTSIINIIVAGPAISATPEITTLDMMAETPSPFTPADPNGTLSVSSSANLATGQSGISPVQFVWKVSGAPNQLLGPVGVKVDQQGNIYVADTGNHRIQVFNSNGTFLRMFGQQGKDDGQFDQPTDVALDGQGNIYVTDGYNSQLNRVQKFDNQGHFLTTWGKIGS